VHIQDQKWSPAAKIVTQTLPLNKATHRGRTKGYLKAISNDPSGKDKKNNQQG
jgi:hypothetical protein